ncbi:PAP2 superfamily protein [Legionella massiliensis]|uniref:PAP2 superfamily protein n=1 Tax=Legionella massiliensis TaxID=1034943 RepID=A0A078KSE2_9GAMM|nr:phosphatase PAP2 family protein [Legionella massiliensis]CDZ75981.1 PAP2 superfamily protein [Legionella massiliensis]CEE11719.1 PAP2 superfamily protein [Legionella massiliensis]
MIDHLARIFLLFSSDLIIIPLVVIGLIWLNRETFYHATCLILFSMLVNVALKNTFQIPLSPALGKIGYAFPSGHMQFVTVLYAWLALRVKNFWLTMAIVIVLIGVALSLIHFGYHNLYDVVAAVFFAVILIGLYYLADLRWQDSVPWLILLFASLLLIYIVLTSEQIAAHVWMAYYGLWGLISAEKIANRRVVALLRSHKLLATLLCFLAIALISTFFHVVLGQGSPAYLYQLQWLLIGFVLPCVNFCTTGLINRFTRVRQTGP